MEVKNIKIIKCSLNLGELHSLNDYEHFNPVIECRDDNGDLFTVKMRLHISENLDGLIFADPRKFADDGFSVNSVGSKAIARKENYEDSLPENIILDKKLLDGIEIYRLNKQSIIAALLDGYNFDEEREEYLSDKNKKAEIAFTCHDPNIIGGGNVIIFRLINWLSQLGVKVTVYSCGAPPSWKRVNAVFKCFKTYQEMFEAIEEKIVIVYSMWHIEPVLKANPKEKLIYHIRQIYEPFHYGTDYESMIARKPVIELLESIKIGIITISPHLEDYYKRLHGLESTLITNGIDPKVFYPSKKRDRSDDYVKIVSVGNPNHFVKGTAVLYKALRILALRKKNLKIYWSILSGGKGNIDYPDIPANLIIEQKIGLNQLQMREEYSDADIFVNPSLYEGFGLPPIEAMLCGTPVVHADNLGLDFIVEDKKDCLVVPVNDEDKTANAIQLLIDDEELSESLAEGGYKKAMCYTVQHQFNNFISAFEKILDIKFDFAIIERIKKGFGYEIDRDYSLKDEISKKKRYNPLVSVVIPSYNQAEYLREALDSLLAQTYSNWEAVVINDGSTDHTEQVMNEYSQKDSRIRVFSKPNGGITSALNAGLDNAKGDFFCWLSSDDLFYPTKLELQIDAFERLDESYALVYGSFDILEESTEQKVLQRQPYANPVIEGCEFPEALKFDFIDGCTIMIRMEVMREVKGFNPGIVHSQDMELWVRLASHGYRFHLLHNKLTIRRVHVAQSSTLNMIHCRYDAAWMINYYLEHYTLLEMYRYINFNSEKGIKNFIEHFTSRTFDTEANINHPLLQEKYWNWFVEGIKPLPINIQNILLRNCLLYFMKYNHTTYKVKYYIEKCILELKKERVKVEVSYDYSSNGRDFRETDRSTDKFAEQLFRYGLDLLVSEHTPLFAQELYFHNTNKLVDTPYKLAHSVFRYLSQFKNFYKNIVEPYLDSSFIPNTKEEALQLYLKCRYGLKSDELIKMFYEKKFIDSKIKQRDNELFQDLQKELKHVCDIQTNIPILYYWYGCILAENNIFEEAVNIGWNITRFSSAELSEDIFVSLSEWALKINDYERAYIAICAALEIKQNDNAIREKKEQISIAFRNKSKILPQKDYFSVSNKDNTRDYIQIKSCKIQPKLDGSFLFSIDCIDNKDGELSATGAIPYNKEIQNVVLFNNSTNEKVVLPIQRIFEYYTNDYDFFEAFDVQTKKRFLFGENLSVSFYAPYTKIVNGGTLVVLRMANWLKDLGVDVSVYSTDEKPNWYELKCPFIRKESKSELFKSVSTDIFIAYSVLDIPEILKCVKEETRIYHIAQVVEDFHYHGFDYNSCIRPKKIFELLHSLPVGRISVSPHITDYMYKTYNQKSFQIINGINLQIFKPYYRINIPGEINICTIGSTNRILKGVYDVVKAVENVAENYTSIKFNLIIVSNDKPTLQQQVNLGNKKINIVLLNNLSQEEMVKVYQYSDIYINASWYEGFGLPSIEAMACGLPVIQANNQGLDKIVEDGKNCLLFKPNNIQEIADKIILLINDFALQKKLISGGLKTAESLSLFNSYKEFIKVFEVLLQTKFDTVEVNKKGEQLISGEFEEKIVNAKNMLRPKFTVLMPIEKTSRGVRESIESLISQSYINWEAVIVFNEDSISQDNYYSITNYAQLDTRIKLKNSTKGELPDLLNSGLKLVTGDWLTFIYPGTIYSPTRLSSQIKLIEANVDSKIIFSEYYSTNSKTNKEHCDKLDIRWLNSLPNKHYQIVGLLNRNYINPSATFLNVSLFEKYGMFEPQLNDAAFYYYLLNLHLKEKSVFTFNNTCFIPKDNLLIPEFDNYRKSIERFLSDISFADLYPELNLDQNEKRWESVILTIYILKNSESFLNKTNCGELLKEKMVLWVTKYHKDELLEKVNLLLNEKNISDSQVNRFFNQYKLDSIITTSQINIDNQKKKDESSKNIRLNTTMVSIVIVTYNQVQYTMECIKSIQEFTKSPYELIIVDNASTDETSWSLIDDEEIIFIQNKINVGFTSAANQGIKIAKGKYIILLNNDTVLTKNWLDKITEIAESDLQIGLVGPISNEVSGLQKDENAKYNSIEEMHEYAAKVAEKNKGEVLNFPRIAFLCTLIKREVIEKIGGLDERFSPGNYEDDDFCLRAQLAGYKTVIVKDVFVHHYGSKSFKANGIEAYKKRLETNKNIFVDKWGVTPDELWLQNKPIKEHGIYYPINTNLFKQYFDRTQIHLNDNELELAKQSVQKAVDNFTEGDSSAIEFNELCSIAGNIHLAVNDVEKAKEYFEMELNTNPSSSSACKGLGDVFLTQENFEAAKTMYEWAVKNDSNNHSAVESLGNVNELLGYEVNHITVTE